MANKAKFRKAMLGGVAIKTIGASWFPRQNQTIALADDVDLCRALAHRGYDVRAMVPREATLKRRRAEMERRQRRAAKEASDGR